MTSGAHDEMFQAMLGDFLDESTLLLERINEGLLQLDEWIHSLDDPASTPCDRDLVNEMFRAAHSIKGLSAMLGLQEINELTHKIENLFDAARNDTMRLSGDTVQLLFRSHDCLSASIASLSDADAEPFDVSAMCNEIQRVLASAGVAKKKGTQADAAAIFADCSSTAGGSATAVAEAPAWVTALPLPAVAEDDDAKDPLSGITDETEIPEKYLAIFLDETELSLDELTETLLAQEALCVEKGTETLLVISHRIKGASAAVGLNRPAKLAHAMEDVLQCLREKQAPLTSDLADLLLRSTDALRSYLQGLRTGAPESNSFGRLCRLLRSAHATVNGPTPAAAPAAKVATPAPSAAIAPAASVADTPALAEARRQAALQTGEAVRGFVGQVIFEPGFPLVTLKAQLVCEKLLHLGQLFYCSPTADELETRDEVDVLTFGLSTTDSAETVTAPLKIAGVARVTLEAITPGMPSAVAGAAATTAAPSDGARGSIVPEIAGRSVALPTKSAGAERSSAGVANDAVAASGKGTAAARGKAETDTSSSKPAETLRVDIERLDQLMNLAGQLVINKARFNQIGDQLKHLVSNKRTARQLADACELLERVSLSLGGTSQAQEITASEFELLSGNVRRVQSELEQVRRDVEGLARARGSVTDLLEAVHQLDRVSDGIQKSVMDTRMVPIGPLFGRFRRVIRDITRSSGKDIRLEILGEKTELDKRMIDELGDPLIHMVRNSADHGVESPEVRLAQGKPAQGTVTLDAFHRGNSIVIQVRDDGKGLDQERIRRKAVERGILSESDAEKLTPHQVYQLIWEPGFSTAEKVTEISGRGMGMDIVRSKIEELNGSVELDSCPGKGTTISIKLPLTLAILPSLMAEIDGDVFALPLESVIEIVRVQEQDLQTVHGLQTARVRNRVISVIGLSDLLVWNQPARKAGKELLDSRGTLLVVLGHEGHEVGLAVDRVLGEEDIVIKSMAENYRNVAGIAGASILGDGSVSLILDTATLIEMASHEVGAAAV